MKRVLTYGTFDVLHYNHLMFLKKAKSFGDYLIVGVSTDEFNYEKKGVIPYYNLDMRKEMVLSIKYVDEVFDQENFEQKKDDILKYNIDILVSSVDWLGKYDYLKDYCEVVYLDKGEYYSSTRVRHDNSIEDIVKAIDV